MSNSVIAVDQENLNADNMLYTYVLTTIGFGFMIGWDIIGLFAPVSPLLSYGEMSQSLVLYTISIGAIALTYIVAVRFSSFALSHCFELVIGATVCGQAVVVCAFARSFIDFSLAFDIVAWILFGISKTILCLGWSVYLSSIPTKYTGIAIGTGGVLGSVFFLFVFTAVPLSLALFGIALLPVFSLAMLHVLSKGTPDKILFVDDNYNKALSSLSKSAAFSNGAHGAVYGFITLYVCLMGPDETLIVGTSGAVGCFFGIVLMKIAPKTTFDNGIVQRIALPVVVIGLLLLSLFEGFGLVLCGCLINSALAFVNIATWGIVTTENHEFHLQPIFRYASRQAPLWIGFLIGAIITITFISASSLHNASLNVIVMLLAACVVVAFSFYGADDSAARQQLEDLMIMDNSREDRCPLDVESSEEEIPAEKELSFEERCEEVCIRYGLSPREREVFRLLARGRNAKVIQEELCVSSSTAKTHIYRIYRKMCINSQQLLIDTVEGRNDPSPFSG